MKKCIFLLLVFTVAVHCYADLMAVRVFGGFAQNYHTPSSAIPGAEIKAGTGLELGAGIQWSRLFCDLAYFGSGHVMEIQSEKAALKFRSFTIRTGCDLTRRTKYIPYVTCNYGRTKLVDASGDGFKNGNAFGIGAGLRYPMGSQVFIDMSLAYNFNRYGSFSVAEAPWADQQHPKLNQLMIGIRVGGLFNISHAAKGGVQ